MLVLGQIGFKMNRGTRSLGVVCGYAVAHLQGTSCAYCAVPLSNPYIHRDGSLPPAEANLQAAKISCTFDKWDAHSIAMKTGLGTCWAYYLDTSGKEWNYWLQPNHATMHGCCLWTELPGCKLSGYIQLH